MIVKPKSEAVSFGLKVVRDEDELREGAAVRLAGSLDKDAVREQLQTMTFRSLLGRYLVDEAGRQTAKQTYVMQWQDGYRLLIMPEAIADSVDWAELAL